MKYAVLGILLAMAQLIGASAFAQTGPHIYMYIIRKHDMDPMPGRGVITGRSWIGQSKEEVRNNACMGFKFELDNWAQGCTAKPDHKPYPYDPKPEVRAMTCQDQVTVKKHLYDSCLAPENAISCSGRGFWAVARTAYPDELLPNGDIGHVSERPAVGGAACGRKTAKAATQAALSSCEKARVAKGLTDLKCYVEDSAELK